MSGQIEIHDVEYRPERSLYNTIGGRDGADVVQLLDGITAEAGVVAAAPRVYAGGLVSSGESTSAGMLMGIDPERERSVSRFLDELVDGRVPQPGRNELAIGTEMARQLAVSVGDDVVVVAPGADGSTGNDLYAVAGIFRTGMVELDASNAVLPLTDLQTLITLDPSRIHEIAVATEDPWIADDAAGRLVAALTPADLGVAVGTLDRAESRDRGVCRTHGCVLLHHLLHCLRYRHLRRRQHHADGDVREAARDRGHAGTRRQATVGREDGPLRSGGHGPRRLGPRVGGQPAAHVLVEHRPRPTCEGSTAT